MIEKFLDIVDGLDRRSKWMIMTLTDVILILVALFAAFALRYGELYPMDHLLRAWPLFVIMVIAGIIYSWILNIPKMKLQSFDLQAIHRIALCGFLLILTAMSMSFLLRFSAPRSVPLIFGILFFSGALLSRMNALIMLRQLSNLGHKRTPVIIYGAGEAGIQLVSSLKQSNEVKPVAFIDDNRLHQKVMIFGLPVYGPQDLERLIKQKKVERILIAIPSLKQANLKAMAGRLAYLPCAIQIMPSNIDIIHGKKYLESLIQVKPEDLLGRDKFNSKLPDISRPYKTKSILISGAGGLLGQRFADKYLNTAQLN